MMYLNDFVVGVSEDQGPKVFSFKEAETRAAPFALSKARDKGLSRVIFFMDAMKVVFALNGCKVWAISPIILVIKTIASLPKYLNFIHSI